MSVILERAESKDEVGRMKDEPEAACLVSSFRLHPSAFDSRRGLRPGSGLKDRCEWPQETPFITAP
jgi:hypothetical protein